MNYLMVPEGMVVRDGCEGYIAFSRTGPNPFNLHEEKTEKEGGVVRTAF
jgi:hypothetical protein